MVLHQAELSPQPANTLRVLLCPPLSAGAAAMNFSIKAPMLEKKGLEAAASPARHVVFLTLALLHPDEVENCNHQQCQHGADHSHRNVDKE